MLVCVPCSRQPGAMRRLFSMAGTEHGRVVYCLLDVCAMVACRLHCPNTCDLMGLCKATVFVCCACRWHLLVTLLEKEDSLHSACFQAQHTITGPPYIHPCRGSLSLGPFEHSKIWSHTEGNTVQVVRCVSVQKTAFRGLPLSEPAWAGRLRHSTSFIRRKMLRIAETATSRI